jgi:hypothetical protein
MLSVAKHLAPGSETLRCAQDDRRLPMRFYLDEDLSDHIADLARAQGCDVVSSHECGRDGLSDEEQLRLAAGEGRCFVTRNRAHFVQLTVRCFERGWPHAGLLLLPGSLAGDRFAAIAGALARYDRQHPEGIAAYTVDFLRV